MRQFPKPAEHLIQHRGDILEFRMILAKEQKGTAWLRSNINNANIRYDEIIHYVENNQSILHRDWHDIPMERINTETFSVRVPLKETGRFEAKTFFIPEGDNTPVWPDGENTIIKVDPVSTYQSNSIYTAFVRQFGKNKYSSEAKIDKKRASATNLLEEAGYTVIPKSGTFRDLVEDLDFITEDLRFRIIQLLPIHPVPTTYARMGRFGSPFAVLDFMDIDPALAEFDRHATPMDQFMELVTAIHARNAQIFLDIPVNHTGWASSLQINHPEWFARNDDNSFKSPGAWGVTWEDLSKLNYDCKDLWKYMAEVFIFWCEKGVNGFRCDAGYKVPLPAWEYIVAKVRRQYPDTIFLLEGLGGPVKHVQTLLDHANLNWAYSEMFQCYDRTQMENYLPTAIDGSLTVGTLIHFAETHDNNRLASKSINYAIMRTAMSAMFSDCGAFGITNGVEWFSREKIIVHENKPLNWNAKKNQVALIKRLNAILEVNPLFASGTKLRLIQRGDCNCLALLRSKDERSLMILVNLDDTNDGNVSWLTSEYQHSFDGPLFDLISGSEIKITTSSEETSMHLNAGQVLCLSDQHNDLDMINEYLSAPAQEIIKCSNEQLKAKLLDIATFLSDTKSISESDLNELAIKMASDPRSFCANIKENEYVPVVDWTWPVDRNRIVLLPKDHAILVNSESPFIITIKHDDTTLTRETGLPAKDGSFFTFITPNCIPKDISTELQVNIIVFEKGNVQKAESRILYLTQQGTMVQKSWNRAEITAKSGYAIITNNRGAMAQVRGSWNTIESLYDAFLAANLNDSFPVDRHIMFTRCRAWVVNKGYSQEININCTRDFSFIDRQTVLWRFDIPVGSGKQVPIEIQLHIHDDQNAISIIATRPSTQDTNTWMEPQNPITLIIRPDIEDRTNHETTKAYTGIESSFPRSIRHKANGFTFSPAPDRILDVKITEGSYHHEPEWLYAIAHNTERERGLENMSDLFSPGYFTTNLYAESSVCLSAQIGKDQDTTFETHSRANEIVTEETLIDATKSAIDQFIVKRDDYLTIIAGYPWFLDWGRDTLICLRGIIAAGRHKEAAEILQQFARFELEGTIPNMIRGNDDSNRDTSDAPLWFCVACSDLVQASGDNSFLDTTFNNRTIRDVMVSIATHYLNGTSNGIKMDSETGLIFSPSHFTWMDTNHPSGTPREGYPIEIQALWYATLKILELSNIAGDWTDISALVEKSVLALFPIEKGLSDCLHASHNVGANNAIADDAIRPNQLLAITLGLLRDKALCRKVLSSSQQLLVPGGIRSLADSYVKHPISVKKDGKLLNDPHRPYCGEYSGDEDTKRKPAYHNGTAWNWMFSSYSEALYKVYGPSARSAALDILASSEFVINRGCIGQITEIMSGDAPHCDRGCGAQAWSVTELYRMLAYLKEEA